MNKRFFISIIVVIQAFALTSAFAQGIIIPLTPSDSTLLPNPRPHKSPENPTPGCLYVYYLYDTNALSINIENAPTAISIKLLDDIGFSVYEYQSVYVIPSTYEIPLPLLQLGTTYTLYYIRNDEEWVGSFIYN